jgi:transposase
MTGVIGVIDMELLSVIRRWHHRDRIPVREIERRTSLSRNTIRKYLRLDAVEVKFKVPERPSRRDVFADKLSEWLRVEAGKGRKGRRTVRRIHADLVALGYDGSYAQVAAFVRRWQARRETAQRTTGRGVFVPLAFQPGEAFQFDWSEDWATVGGKRLKLQAAHTKLSHSRAFVIRAYKLQTHEMLFDALAEAFRVLGGVPRRGIFDNMRTAVDRVGTGKVRQVNARFQAMASHYLFEPTFCSPASGWGEPWSATGPSDRASGSGREKRPGRPAADLAGHAAVHGSARPQPVAGGPLHRALERAPPWGPAGQRRRGPRPGEGEPDADGTAVRRLRRTRQAGVADLPRAFRGQPLQRPRLLRQSAGQPARLP